MSPRRRRYWASLGGIAFALACLAWAGRSSPAVVALAVVIASALGVLAAADWVQERDALRRNFPLLGRFPRWLGLPVRSPAPFPEDTRALVVARSLERDPTLSFGARHCVVEPGALSVRHAIEPASPEEVEVRVTIGGPGCTRPYEASILNASALSFGAVSNNALRALGAGAKLGGFAVNTGEGGFHPALLEGGGDIVWQIGTGYFGCRTEAGAFDDEAFARVASRDVVKMIELKLSQGAKPGHGGILLGSKVTREVAEVCGIPAGVDSICPARHSAFTGPRGLLAFVERLRALSGGKPVGIKLCVGRKSDFLAICKAILETGIAPDFITVDGSEGGAGAAPVEFARHIGAPLDEGLVFVHNALVGAGVRDRIRVIASGKIATGFDIVTRLALGADLCAAARAFMFSLGCLQALECQSNTCPSGVTSQDPRLARGLVPAEKKYRVSNFHGSTIHAYREIVAAMGLTRGHQIRPSDVFCRTDAAESRSYAELFDFIPRGALLNGSLRAPDFDALAGAWAGEWAIATAESFDRPVE